MFVLDTNTLIYFFKGQGRVAENFLQQSPQEIGIPAVVLYELQVGILKSTFPEKRRQQLAELIAVVTILSFGQVESELAARIRTNLERQGQPIGPYDILIAATALAAKGTLVTHNIGEFGRIENLSLVDWY